MLVFGHAGITLGIAVLLVSTSSGKLPVKATGETRHLNINPPELPSGQKTAKRLSWATFFGNWDMRAVLIGSLLPDIIDKPIGQFFFRDTFSNGRIISHTLLFLVLITLSGLYLYQSRRRTSLISISFATFIHFILDQMWQAPWTLLWPVYGFTFDRADLNEWPSSILHELMTNPGVYIPELVGGIILICFAVTVVRKRKVSYFLKHG